MSKCNGTDQIVFGVLVDHHYDAFSEAILTNDDSGIGGALAYLDQSLFDGYFSEPLKKEFKAMAETRESLDQYCDKGK